MSNKPRVRVRAGASFTEDSFKNVAANLGYGTNPLLSAGTYSRNNLSRDWTKLSFMYRGSWLVRRIVDSIPEDMTRAGVDFTGDFDPKHIDHLHEQWRRLRLWDALRDGMRWARLYGGAVGFIMIEGQRPETPLRMETVGKGAFKGIYVLDRWMLNPETQVVEEMGPDLGKPEFYSTNTLTELPTMRIHYSRIIRFEGDPLPYWERFQELGWGASVMEQVLDRMIAYDSASVGAAQLVFKAHLRTYKVPGLRELIAAGGQLYQAFLENMQLIRQMQSNEGLTVIDGDDSLEYHTNSAISGLADALREFGQQLSGASKIPLVILFGQSPQGFNTGETDIRSYYDMISSQQKDVLEEPVRRLTSLLYRSEYGEACPEGWGFTFNPLWQLSDEQKGHLASSITSTVMSAHEAGLISDKTALMELRQSADTTGVWTNITDEDINAANPELPQPGEGEAEMPPMPGADPGEELPAEDGAEIPPETSESYKVRTGSGEGGATPGAPEGRTPPESRENGLPAASHYDVRGLPKGVRVRLDAAAVQRLKVNRKG